MNPETLSCGLCFNQYNKADRLPRILISCGDTLCTACIQRLLGHNNSFECPFDKTKCHLFKRGIETFPTNTALVQLLGRASAPETRLPAGNLCKEHGEEMRLFCIKDKVMICDDCLGQEHKGHYVKSIKKIKSEAVEEKNKLEKMLVNMEKYQADWATEVDQEKTQLIKEVKTKFQELKWQLMKKESEVVLEIGNMFDNEKQKAESNNGQNTSMKSSINGRILQLREMIQNEDYSKTHEDNAGYNVDQSTIEKQLESFKQNLKELSGTVDKSLATQFDAISNIGVSLGELTTTLVKMTSNFEEETDNSTTPSITTMTEPEDYSKITHFFRIDKRPNYLLILLRSKNQFGREQPPDFDKLKQETKVTLKVGRANITDEVLRALSLLWKKLGDIISFKLDYSSDFASDTQFTNLLPIIFSRSRTISKIEINMERCRIGDPSFCMLFEDVLPRLLVLSNLHLNFKSTDITDKSLEVFAANMLPNIKKLQIFRFFLSKTKVTDAGLTPIFVNMERLKSFVLDLEFTKVTDNAIEALAANTIVPSAVNLEDFELAATKTKVTDQSIFQLFSEMPRMKNFVLSVGGTSVGDASIEGLATRSLPTMQNLESFELFLWETRVSDKSLLYLSCNMEKLKKFKLHIGSLNVTDKTLFSISKNIMSSIKTLEELDLSLKNTYVSDEGVLAMLGNVQKVRKLGLNVGSTSATDRWVEKFARDIVTRMEALESLKLYMWSTKVTNQGMVRLFGSLRNLSALNVYLQETKVSDECVEEFLSCKGSIMRRNYDDLEIDLKGTDVSDKLKAKIAGLRKSFN